MQIESLLSNFTLEAALNSTMMEAKQLMTNVGRVFTFPYQMLAILCILTCFYTFTLILNLYYNTRIDRGKQSIKDKETTDLLTQVQSL